MLNQEEFRAPTVSEALAATTQGEVAMSPFLYFST
jgi:hypothetical protein